MNLIKYQEEAARTCPSIGSLKKDLLHMNLGITTEMGEIADCLKRKIAYGKEIDLIHLREEIGDVLWYAVNKARMTDFVFEFEDTLELTDELDIAEILTGFNWSKLPVDEIVVVMESLANFYNMTLEECMEVNINKLYTRYPEKFTQDAALNRDLDAERKTLEK